MHCVAIRRDLYEREPWVAQSLYKGFLAAKELALTELENTSSLQSMLPWPHAMLEQARTVLGRDIYPFGVEASRPTLETMARYCRDQHLVAQPSPIEQLFAQNTYAEFKI